MEKYEEYYKLGNTIEEFEGIFGNTPFDNLDKIKKYLFDNYIPKSLIKEKIEEYEKMIKATYGDLTYYGDKRRDVCMEIKQVLEELLTPLKNV